MAIRTMATRTKLTAPPYLLATSRSATMAMLTMAHTYRGYTYYLKERTGDMAGALGLILEALHRALRQLLPEVTA